MTEAQLPALITQVLWAAFALAAVFGAVAQHTQFCTMGAVTDIITMGDWTRMRMWVLAMAVAVLGFNGLVAAGILDAAKTVYAAPRVLWLSSLVGGALFGFGMVLASGCGGKTLVRIGGGSLKSLVVFLVLGLAAFATLKGITAVARVATVDAVGFTLPVGQDLPSLLAYAFGTTRPLAALAAGSAIGLALVAWVVAKQEGRTADVWLAGLGLGGCVVAVWWVSGQFGHLSEHPQTLEEAFLATNTGRMESLSFVSPMAYTLDWLVLFSDKTKVLTLGIVSTWGVIAGSAVVALRSGRFRWEGLAGTQDTAKHLIGAVCMGVGGITAMGCTIGQGLTGISTLALGSFMVLAAIVAGAVLGLRCQIWLLERQA